MAAAGPEMWLLTVPWLHGLDTRRTWFDETVHEELVVTEKGTRTW